MLIKLDIKNSSLLLTVAKAGGHKHASLRWNYPVQVQRVEGKTFLSALSSPSKRYFNSLLLYIVVLN
jgi:hypothetical protein